MAKLSRQDIVRESGISQSTLSQYFSGKRLPSKTNSKKLADFFNVPFEQIDPRLDTSSIVKSEIAEKIDKVIFEDIKNFYYGTKTLDDKISESDGEFYGSLIGSSFGVITATYTIDNLPKVLNSTLKGGNISSISKISYKTENTSLALYDKSKKITCTSSN